MFGLSISASGRYIVFDTLASNLVADTDSTGGLCVHDMVSGRTTLLSSFGYTGSPSADGRYIAFVAALPNNGYGPLNAFVRNMLTGETEQASVSSTGLQGDGDTGLYGISISGDGRYVAFDSGADNLVAGDTNSSYLGYPKGNDVFVRDRCPWLPPEYGTSATASTAAVRTMQRAPAPASPTAKPSVAPFQRLPARVGFLPDAVRQALTFGNTAFLRRTLLGTGT